MNEDWKPMPGHEGFEISSLGNARRMEQIGIQDRKRGPTVWHLTERPLKPSKNRLGYLWFKPRGVWENAHRLVAKAFIPNPENKRTVNHKNGDKADNRLENLEWMTIEENHAHARDVLGHGKQGEDNVKAKLTENDVLDIRALRGLGATLSNIANAFDISISAAHHVVARRTWRHVP